MKPFALLSRSRWRQLSQALYVLGAVGVIGSGIALELLGPYYSSHRTHQPRPEQGLSLHIRWTHPPSYGTADDAATMNRVFAAGFYAIAVIAMGLAVRIYILGEAAPIRGERARFGCLERHTSDKPE